MGEVWQRRIGVGEVGNAHFDGDDAQHTTASDHFEVKGVVGEPKTSHVKLVLVQQVQTGHVQWYYQNLYKWWKRGNAMCVSAHWLQRNKPQSGTQTAKLAWSSEWTSICHNSWPQWPANGSHKWKSKNGVPGLVHGTCITSSTMGGASCTHAGVPLGFGNALVPVQKSWCHLATRSTLGSANPKGSGHCGTGPGRS